MFFYENFFIKDDDKQAAYMEKKRKEIAEEKKVLEEDKKKLAQLKAKTKAKKDEMERKKSAMIADIEAKTLVFVCFPLLFRYVCIHCILINGISNFQFPGRNASNWERSSTTF